MTVYSDPTDLAQLCDRCRAEVGAAASRNTFTMSSNVTDRDDRERLLREAHESGKQFKMCARCALRPVTS